MRIRIIISSLIMLVALSGCSSILNPYSSDFTCPKTENGKCVDMETAHEESLAKTGRKNSETGNTSCRGKDCGNREKSETSEKSGTGAGPDITYQDELYKKLAGLLAQPATPVVAPPSVMRVLMFPYKGDENELYMMRYVYIIIDGPKWVMGDYLFTDKDGK